MNSLFSRRHYEAIAAVMRETSGSIYSDDHNQIFTEILDALSNLFEADNERFRPERFREACER